MNQDIVNCISRAESYWASVVYRHLYEIVPKPFTIERISEVGQTIFGYCEGQTRSLSGILCVERTPGFGRVFFLPAEYHFGDLRIFPEVKGYGQDGRDIALDLHEDGDIRFGMFYKNAAKEYRILEQGTKAGLRVPLPLLLGRISRNVWFTSGMHIVADIVRKYKPHSKVDLPESYTNMDFLEKVLQEALQPYPSAENPIGSFKQPYNAGLVIRGPRSPLRLGDPSNNYTLTNTNCFLARSCGDTFMKLLNLGYLHLCPGTGNWTIEGELTDMSDCYDLQKDRNLAQIIEHRQRKMNGDFWETLIGKQHTANLTVFFIEGMLGMNVSLKEAAQELKKIVDEKIKLPIGAEPRGI